MQNLVDLVAVGIFPVLISIPHTTLLYLFCSSAFLKTMYHLNRLVDSRSDARTTANQPTKKKARSTDEEAVDKHSRPTHVSVKTMSDNVKAPENADVNVLLDRAVVAYAKQNRGVTLIIDVSVPRKFCLSAMFCQHCNIVCVVLL